MNVKLLYGPVDDANIYDVYVEVCSNGCGDYEYHVKGVFAMPDGVEKRGVIDVYETPGEAFTLCNWLTGELEYENQKKHPENYVCGKGV